MRTLISAFILAIVITGTVQAQDISAEDIQARLKQLEAELLQYQEQLEETESQKSGIEETLERNERNINDLLKEINRIEGEIDGNKERISRLKSEQKELLLAKEEQQHQLARQVRAAYEIGNQEYLKVLLNQEDPNEIARMLTFYDYFNEARAREVQGYNRTLEQLDIVSLALATETQSLQKNRAQRESQHASLSSAQREQRKSLEALINEITSTGTAISKLEQDREHLEKLLDRLAISLASIKAPNTAQPFAGMKGKLLLPTSGKITHGFGHHRNQGKLQWHGVFIEADEGEPVHAVHYGRVVFSDWLRGFGLLMIINHGDGYMSLYGHNQVLYFETGEWVTAGDVIATVGNTGGQNTAGLYFEIRIAGEPSDPEQWCIARQQGTA